MLRAGLTGGLGRGKSPVAARRGTRGAEVIEADELGRALMEPGQPVFSSIVAHFGPAVVSSDGRLNRARLADLAFKEGRLQELNALVHPAVIAAEQRCMEQVFARDPAAVAVVESALIFEVERDACARGESGTVLADWRRRFDRILVVTAPDELKVGRFASRVCPDQISPDATNRATAEAEARIRLTHQIPDAVKAAQADYVIDNSGDIETLRAQVESLWPRLMADCNKFSAAESLE